MQFVWPYLPSSEHVWPFVNTAAPICWDALLFSPRFGELKICGNGLDCIDCLQRILLRKAASQKQVRAAADTGVDPGVERGVYEPYTVSRMF